MRKNWIVRYFQLWGLLCPSKGSVDHDSGHKERGRAAGEKFGSQKAGGQWGWILAAVLLSHCPALCSDPEQMLLSPVSTEQTQMCRVLVCRAVRPGSQSALYRASSLKKKKSWIITNYSRVIFDVLANSSWRQVVPTVRQTPCRSSSRGEGIHFSVHITWSPWRFLLTHHHVKIWPRPHRSQR